MDIRKRRIQAYKSSQGKKSGPEEKPGELDPDPATHSTGERNKPENVRNAAASDSAAADAFLKIAAGEKGYRKAAQFLLLLGRDEAAEVLKHMKEEEVEGITREIAGMDSITPGEVRQVLSEFGRLRENRPEAVITGGYTVAQEILNRAFGAETSDRVFKNALSKTERPFAFLSDLDIQQVMLILRGEGPAVLAVILALTEPSLSASILKSLGADIQKDVVKRLAGMQRVDPSVIVKIEESLREKIRNTGKVVTEQVNGKSTLVDILRFIDSKSEQRILDGLRDQNPDLFEEVSDMLFSPEIILQIEEMSLQNALRDFSDQDIALFLKGKSEIIRQKILANVSERRRSFIVDEYRALGAVRKTDVDDMTKSFLERFRKLYEEGTLVIFDEGDQFIR